MKEIILASKSPRRSELLTQMGYKFQVMASDIIEDVKKDMNPDEIVKDLAYQKAQDIKNRLSEKGDSIIIGADTIVTINNTILNKPKDEKDAKTMLNSLSARSHKVYTGVCVIDTKTGVCDNFYQVTTVYMKTLSDKEIDEYILTKEPLDKAGAYGIQGFGGVFVDKIEGDYFSVMGLPIAMLYDSLKSLI